VSTPQLLTPFPYTTLFRSGSIARPVADGSDPHRGLGINVHERGRSGSARHLRVPQARRVDQTRLERGDVAHADRRTAAGAAAEGSEEHTSELQSLAYLVCR